MLVLATGSQKLYGLAEEALKIFRSCHMASLTLPAGRRLCGRVAGLLANTEVHRLVPKKTLIENGPPLKAESISNICTRKSN